MKQLIEVIETFVSFVQIAGQKFREWIETIDWQKVYEYFEFIQNGIPEALGIVSIDLANKGWFVWILEGSFSDVVEKLNNLIGKDEEYQNKILIDYFISKLELIEKEIIIKYPHRINQIKDAFAAHKNKLYYSSIPAFLILAESIFRDIYPSVGLYAKKNKEPQTAQIVNSLPFLEAFEEAVLRPLKIRTKMTETITKPTFEQNRSLHRHLIIHGISSNYGSLQNSLKALSLVYFVHNSLTFIKEKEHT